MKTLTIKLQGPLQSYGDEATFDRRTSADYPCKSAVLGLIGAALGYQRTDLRFEELNDLAFAVRIDQPGTPLSEFQTVEWKPGTRKVTYRGFIQDAVFIVAVASADHALIDQIEFAIHHPKFPLFLGRRANVPAGVMVTTTHSDENPIEVLTNLPWAAASWFTNQHRNNATYQADIYADAELLPNRSNRMIKDALGSYDQRNRYHQFRAVAHTTASLSTPPQSDNLAQFETTHDIFKMI